MDIHGTDPAAEVQVVGTTLTICFHFDDEETAQRAAKALIACHARGEDVTITLSNAHLGMLQ